MIHRKKVEPIDISEPVKITHDNINRIFLSLRKTKGYGQYTLAKELGVHELTVRKWEHGETTPPMRFFLDILDYYGYELELKKK